MEKKYCQICGKEIPEKRIMQGKTTCCHRCAVKQSCLNPEVSKRKSEAQKKRFQDSEKYKSFCDKMSSSETRQKLSNAGKKRYAKEEERQKSSEIAKKLHQDPTYREHFEKAMKSKETLDKISKAQKKRFQNAEYRESFKKTMSSPEVRQRLSISNKQTFTNEDLRQHISFKIKDAYKKNGKLIVQKRTETMKQNRSFNTSKPEENAYLELVKVFGIVERQKQYPTLSYHCDFYIPSIDLYIEYNGIWTHGGRAFNENDISCLEQLAQWKKRAKSSKFYRNAIEVWTKSDVKRAQCAIDNKLNWLCFYTYEEFKQWISQFA